MYITFLQGGWLLLSSYFLSFGAITPAPSVSLMFKTVGVVT